MYGKSKYTILKTLIIITIKSSIGLSALSLPLWHSITFEVFSLNSMKFSVVIENAVGYNFLYANHSLAGPTDARWSENAKCYIFEIPPKDQVYFSLISKDQKHKMCSKNTFLTFQYSFETRL